MKSGIVTRGYGYKRSTIITRGYGDIIDIIRDVVEVTTRGRVGGTKATKRKISDEIEELCVSVSLIELNGKINPTEITNNLCKRFSNANLAVSIDDVEVISTNDKTIDIRVNIRNVNTIRTKHKVSVTIKDN
jgi:hypothetical protein